MSSRNYNGKKKEKTVEEDEVDELLKAAQDDMVLKLSLNSHMAHSSSQISGIDPDLDSRFQALKKPYQSKSNSKSTSKSKLDDTASRTQKNPEKVVQNIDESDDLFARFAALKSSLPSCNSSVRDSQVQQQQQQQLMDDDGDGQEDEVEKVIKWAIDAARLDPSPPSDSDDDAARGADDDSDDEDDDGHGVDAGEKGKRK